MAAWLPRDFLWTLAGYSALAAGYSLHFKRRALVDVLILASLYTLRVVAGAVAVEVPLSFWLLAFSVFLFFSIALLKRCVELRGQGGGPADGPAGRDYPVGDLPVLRAMGLASGYVAVLVFALYINSGDVGERCSEPRWLWLSCPALLYWVSRAWFKESRGEMHDDPLIDAAPALKGLLASIGGGARDLLERRLLDPAATDLFLSSFGMPAPFWISTDDNLKLEYSTPRGNVLDGTASIARNIELLMTVAAAAGGCRQ